MCCYDNILDWKCLMIIIIVLLIIIGVIYTIVAIIRSEKSFKHILRETKVELAMQVVGVKVFTEDMLNKNKISTDLPNKTGQVAIVTGGSRGIGVEIVKMLLRCNMHVVIACRNVKAGIELEPRIREEGITTGEVKVFPLDTSSMKSVGKFSEQMKELYPKIHLLVNNAGIMFGPYVETEDNFESQFAVNYVGHFLLTHLLLAQLAAAGADSDCKSRIVNVSSAAHSITDMNFEDIHSKNQYIPTQAYAQSKLAQIISTIYLEHMFKTKKLPIQIHAVHPGVVNTDLFDGTPLKKLFPWLPKLLFKNPVQGATTVVYACVSPVLEGVGGTYLSNCKIIKNQQSLEVQEKLFDVTKQMLNIAEFGKTD